MALYTRPGSPYWYADVVGPDGRRIQKSTKVRYQAPTPSLRAEAKRLAEVIEAEWHLKLVGRLHGKPDPKPASSVAGFVDWYETHVTAHHRGAAREREILETLRAAFAGRTLASLTTADVQEWMTARRKDVRASTVNRELDVLKHLLKAAVPQYLDASPAASVKRLRAEKRPMIVLSRADEKRLLTALAPADQAIVVAALDTLARAGELLALRWADDHGSYLTILNPKAGDSRKVPVSKRLRTMLDRLRKQGGRRPQYIFAHRRKAKDARSHSNSVKQMLEDGCERAGVTYGREAGGITFHGLRHTGATRMIEAGVSLRIVQAIGGWSDLRMLTRYTHPSEGAMLAAVEVVAGDTARDTRRKRVKTGRI